MYGPVPPDATALQLKGTLTVAVPHVMDTVTGVAPSATAKSKLAPVTERQSSEKAGTEIECVPVPTVEGE